MKSGGLVNIDDKAVIPLWSVLSIIPIFIGAVFWISSLSYDVAEAKNDIIETKTSMVENHKVLLDIRDRVIRIEAHYEDSKTKRR